MIFIETPVFTKLVEELLPHDNYVELQHALLLRPVIQAQSSMDQVACVKAGGASNIKASAAGFG